MKVVVLSDDPDGSAPLRDLPAQVDRRPLEGSAADADIVVWKPDSVARLPRTLPRRPQVFVLPARELAAFHRRFPGCAARVLVDPAPPRVLCHAVAELAAAPERALLEWLLSAAWRLQTAGCGRANFLGRMLYDARAPLTAACGYCGLLADKCLGPLSPAQNDTVAGLQRSLERITAAFDDALLFGACDPGLNEDALAPGSLEECMERAIAELSHVAEAKGIEFVVRMSEQPETVRFDPGRMTGVFLHLLENASRFAVPRTAVAVTGYSVTREDRSWIPVSPPQADGYRIDVSDSGPGIPPERATELFREDAPYLPGGDRTGPGLGLAVCRLVLEGHKGELFADGREHGATFSLVLPAVPVSRRQGGPVLPVGSNPEFQVLP